MPGYAHCEAIPWEVPQLTTGKCSQLPSLFQVRTPGSMQLMMTLWMLSCNMCK